MKGIMLSPNVPFSWAGTPPSKPAKTVQNIVCYHKMDQTYQGSMYTYF